MLWVIALAIGFLGPLFEGVEGWRVQPAHFVERHGLIVIIAIGESLIAIGLGARSTGLGGGEIVAALLGLVVATSFWLAYFDYFPIRAQQLLDEREGLNGSPSHATSTPTSTSRWWRGSCSSRSRWRPHSPM